MPDERKRGIHLPEAPSWLRPLGKAAKGYRTKLAETYLTREGKPSWGRLLGRTPAEETGIALQTPHTAAVLAAREAELGLPPTFPGAKTAPTTTADIRQLITTPTAKPVTPPAVDPRVGQPTGKYETLGGYMIPYYFGSDGTPYLNLEAAIQEKLPAAGFPRPTTPPPKDAFGREAIFDPRTGDYTIFPPNFGVDPKTLEAGYNPNLIPAPSAEAPTDPYGRRATWDPDNGEWRYPPDWGKDPKTLAAGYISPAEQTQIDLRRAELEATTQGQKTQADIQREQLAATTQWQQSQLAAERQRQLASLRASPSSWLEYASLAGETPAIQPWMQPLMPQQYGFQAGQPLPGWTPEGSLGGMPALTRPSAQYLSRVGPTATQQFYGYEQARTGAPPQETEWRQWAGAPPGGRFQGLARTR